MYIASTKSCAANNEQWHL